MDQIELIADKWLSGKEGWVRECLASQPPLRAAAWALRVAAMIDLDPRAFAAALEAGS